jgi:hypothetical protein
LYRLAQYVTGAPEEAVFFIAICVDEADDVHVPLSASPRFMGT